MLVIGLLKQKTIMLLRLFLLFSLTVIFSFCTAEEGIEMEKENNGETGSETGNPTMRFLALGDSYTIGQGVTADSRWPVLLTDTLIRSGFKMEDPQIIARTGWTTGELKAGIDAASPKGPFKLVSLLIGVNNQYRGVSSGYTMEGYRDEFSGLLQMAIGFAEGDPDRVFVVSIPDYSVTSFVPETSKERVSLEIDQYNSVNRQIAENLSVINFDITPSSRLAAEDLQLLASDNLHPSGKMYRMWVDIMTGDIIKMLK